MTSVCTQIMRDLSAFVDGELDTDRARQIDRHMASCSGCSTELRRLERLRDLVIMADPASSAPTVNLEASVVRRIRTVRVGPSMLRWQLATAAMVCIAVGVGVIIGMGLNDESPQMVGDLPQGIGNTRVQWRGSSTIGDDDVDMMFATLGQIESGDIDAIIAVLMPAGTADSELTNQALWYESPVEELIDTLTGIESEELRGELYNYAIQG